jgi:polysaccharide biosynthesis/export protein
MKRSIYADRFTVAIPAEHREGPCNLGSSGASHGKGITRKLTPVMKIALFITGLLFPILLVAQTPAGPGDANRAAQYFLGNQDQVLMAVNVWGFVNKPGQYMVPYDTDLISLLSYAGGPREEAKIKNIKVVRPGKDHDAQDLVIDVDVKRFLQTGKAVEIPVLKPGDTVVVSGTNYYFVSKFFEFAVKIGALIQVWALVEFYTKNR